MQVSSSSGARAVIIFWCIAPIRAGRVTVAYHGSRDIPRATIASILRQAQLTADEFLPLL